VHVGGTLAEVARSESDVNAGRIPERPYCLVAQPGVVDPTRAPAGYHTLWGYCHMPSGSAVDASGRIEAQIERFAPGFRDLILARAGPDGGRHGAAQSELRGRGHQQRGGDAAPDVLPAHVAVEPLPDRGVRRLLVLGVHPSRWWSARHVAARGCPCRAR